MVNTERGQEAGVSLTKWCNVIVKSVGILCSLHVWSPSLAGQIFGLVQTTRLAWPRRCAALLSLLCRTGATTLRTVSGGGKTRPRVVVVVVVVEVGG